MKELKCICNNKNLTLFFNYNRKPFEETDFGINIKIYNRKFYKCINCDHFIASHSLDLEQLYKGLYVNKTYDNNIEKIFMKILNLPNNKSDNFFRVKRVIQFSELFFKKYNTPKKLLDIGSGIGIFPFKIKNKYNVTALDPDQNSINFLNEKLKLKTIHGNYSRKITSHKFNVVTLNKVLEHLKKPEKILSYLKYNLLKNHFIYIEVPDGDQASKFGKNREEFFIEHYHAFSKSSLNILLKKTGFEVLEINSLIEPSGKFTIFAFAKKK